jgi:ribosome modulation factor
MRLIQATTSWEEGLDGLSKLMTPYRMYSCMAAAAHRLVPAAWFHPDLQPRSTNLERAAQRGVPAWDRGIVARAHVELTVVF